LVIDWQHQLLKRIDIHSWVHKRASCKTYHGPYWPQEDSYTHSACLPSHFVFESRIPLILAYICLTISAVTFPRLLDLSHSSCYTLHCSTNSLKIQQCYYLSSNWMHDCWGASTTSGMFDAPLGP
jgi:hypothetical protein